MSKRLYILFVLFMPMISMAQLYPYYKHHDWVETPVHSEREVNNELYFYTKYLLAVEYEYDLNAGQYYKYETQHYKVKLTTHAGIEEFNKIYISMDGVYRIKKLSTRVIKKDKVVKLTPKVEEFYSEDEEERYYYFPISGIELGDEIEVMYTLQKEPEFDGDQFFFQSDIPIYDFEFFFISPNDSYFQFLPHNGLAKPALIDTILQKHQWYIQLDSIPAEEPEYFSEYNNTIMKLDASLRGFDTPTDKSYSPYEEFNLLLNVVYNINFSGKDAKALRELNTALGIYNLRSKEDKVRVMEHFIKTDVLISSSVPDQSMADIVKNRKANSVGTILLFMGMCQQADIEYQYGFISDRYDTRLSSEIESMYFLQNYFLYFPEIDKYLAPLDFSTRLGYLKADWIPNNGYFLKQKQYPALTTDWEVRPVKGTTAQQNVDSIVIRVNVDENMEDGELTIERYIKGYKAGQYQTYYYLYSENRKKEKQNELLNFFQDASKFKMTDIENVEPEDAFVKPLIIKGKMTELYRPFIEKANDKTIFKLGNLFGEHVSVNDLTKKKNDFVFSNPMIRTYSVIVTFPKGVTITNKESVFQTEDYCALDGILMKATFEQEGNTIKFVSREEYQSYRYSIEDKEEVFNAFRYYDELTKINLIIK
ncbi:MAG: DUF3857 domain-containing protein [Crocinitomicaceae bacterium]|nr:DUF3857 domain-containing protein [Crocinitomicaceae bacterium]